MSEQQRIREALATLTETLASIARTADAKNRERCPYKTVDLRCTYRGTCQNQRASHSCAGDDLNFEPVFPQPSAQPPESR